MAALRAATFFSLLLASAPAHAAFLRVGGVALPGQGFVTAQPGAIEERFDGPGFPTVTAFTFPFGSVGARTPGESVPNQHQAPRSDSGGYLAVGNWPFTAQLQLQLNGDFRYVGFDWGSIDEYNTLRFLDDTLQPIFFENFGTQISGLALAEFLQIPLYNSLYIDFSFFRSPVPRVIELRSTNNAFELDNLAFATASIIPTGAVFDPDIDRLFGDPAWANLPARPEPFGDDPLQTPGPAALGLLAMGVAALGIRARRQ